MACLSGEVEQIVLVPDQISHAEFIPYVGDVDANPALVAFQIEVVPAVLGDKAVNDSHMGAQVGQDSGQVASDETEPPGDENPLPGEILKICHTG